ncbi:MAG: LysE family transporter [Limisphaerales bacterium]
MPELPPTLLAVVAGFVTALIFSSIPIGPVNLTIINEGAQRGFKWAMLIGLGAAAMEVAYSAIAFTGFSSFFDKHLVATIMKVLTFVFLLVLGIKFLMAKRSLRPRSSVPRLNGLKDVSRRNCARIPRSPSAWSASWATSACWRHGWSSPLI